jgi:hypothetical protein
MEEKTKKGEAASIDAEKVASLAALGSGVQSPLRFANLTMYQRRALITFVFAVKPL